MSKPDAKPAPVKAASELPLGAFEWSSEAKSILRSFFGFDWYGDSLCFLEMAARAEGRVDITGNAEIVATIRLHCKLEPGNPWLEEADDE